MYESIFNTEIEIERGNNENIKILYIKPEILSFVRKKRLE